MITLLFNPFTVALLWLGGSAPFVAFSLGEGATPAVNTGIFLFCWGMLDCMRLSVAFMPLALRWSVAMRWAIVEFEMGLLGAEAVTQLPTGTTNNMPPSQLVNGVVASVSKLKHINRVYNRIMSAPLASFITVAFVCAGVLAVHAAVPAILVSNRELATAFMASFACIFCTVGLCLLFYGAGVGEACEWPHIHHAVISTPTAPTINPTTSSTPLHLTPPHPSRQEDRPLAQDQSELRQLAAVGGGWLQGADSAGRHHGYGHSLHLCHHVPRLH